MATGTLPSTPRVAHPRIVATRAADKFAGLSPPPRRNVRPQPPPALLRVTAAARPSRRMPHAIPIQRTHQTQSIAARPRALASPQPPPECLRPTEPPEAPVESN